MLEPGEWDAYRTVGFRAGELLIEDGRIGPFGQTREDLEAFLGRLTKAIAARAAHEARADSLR
jgi:hypothetical protein